MEIVKRQGHRERFDERKLYASIYSAALVSGYGEKKSEKLANDVAKLIKRKVMKKEATSDFIKKHVVAILKKKNKDIAFLYDTHLDIS